MEKGRGWIAAACTAQMDSRLVRDLREGPVIIEWRQGWDVRENPASLRSRLDGNVASRTAASSAKHGTANHGTSDGTRKSRDRGHTATRGDCRKELDTRQYRDEVALAVDYKQASRDGGPRNELSSKYAGHLLSKYAASYGVYFRDLIEQQESCGKKT
jgi:hypothetical protein